MQLEDILLQIVCVKTYNRGNDYLDVDYESGFESTREFFARFGNAVDFKGKNVLEVGCGLGQTSIYLALNGAEKVLGVDKQENIIDFGRKKLEANFYNIIDRVEFKKVPDIEQLNENDKFDIILSKDSFEHFDDPEGMIRAMKRLLSKNGIIMIGFGPLWKAPNGGHIFFMTKLPWAHLLFSEEKLMKARTRLLPNEPAKSFREVPDGLNKMTLKKFKQLMADSGLKCMYFRTNVSTKIPIIMKLSTILCKFPFCREYFTWNVYSIWSNIN